MNTQLIDFENTVKKEFKVLETQYEFQCVLSSPIVAADEDPQLFAEEYGCG